MKISEFFWEKAGSIAITSFIGAIYGLMVSPILGYLFPPISVGQVVKVFCLVFSVFGLISGNFLIKSTVGLIYTIAGFFFGLGVGAARSDAIEQSFRTSAAFTLIGVICGVFITILYY